MKKDWLDKRICDVESGDNTQTYREFIIETESEFGLDNRYKELDDMSDIELTDLLDYLDDLWDK